MSDEADGVIVVCCVRGWEASSSEDVVVEATQERGRRRHNMDATRDEVLAMAVGRDAGEPAGQPRRSGHSC